MQTHSELIKYLQDSTNSLACDEMDKFVDGLTSWVNSSNFKVSILFQGNTVFQHLVLLLEQIEKIY